MLPDCKHLDKTIQFKNLRRSFGSYYPYLKFSEASLRGIMKYQNDPHFSSLTKILASLSVFKDDITNIQNAGIRSEKVRSLNNVIELKSGRARLYYCNRKNEPHIRAVQLYKNEVKQKLIIRSLDSPCQVCEISND